MMELNKEVTTLRTSVKKERIRFERRLMASRSEEEKEVTKAWILQMIREAFQEIQDEEASIEAVQAALL